MKNLSKKILILTTSVMAFSITSCGVNVSNKSLDISALASALQSNYYLEVDNRTLLDGMISGLTQAFGDDFTYYTSAAKNQYQDYSSSGVGLGFSRTVYYGEALVREVMKNSPAQNARPKNGGDKGLLKGDIITKIRNLGTKDNPVEGEMYVLKDHSFSDWTNYFSGEEGSIVEVYYKRKNAAGIYEEQPSPLIVTRGAYNVDKAVLESFTNVDGHSEAYVKISSFLGNANDGETTPQGELKSIFDNEIFTNGVTSLDHLIIDLRGNGGGYVNNCTDTLGLFIPKGQATAYYQFQDNSLQALTNTNMDTQYTSRINHISLIVDSSTASAGETFALGLRDYPDTKNKTHIYGQVSYGKGIAQSFIDPFNDGSSIRYTFARVLSPSKQTINKRGIVPEKFIGQQFIPYKEYTMYIDGVTSNDKLSEENTNILLNRINILLGTSYTNLGLAILKCRETYAIRSKDSLVTSQIYDDYFANQFANKFYDTVVTKLPACKYNAYIEGNDVDNDSFTPLQRRLVKEQINMVMGASFTTFDKAVEAFQKENNILSEDNIFTRETGALLGGKVKDIYLEDYDYNVINEVRAEYGK